MPAPHHRILGRRLLLFWILFNLFVLAMLVLDLGVFHRRAHAVKFREALVWSVVWIALAAIFAVVIFFWHGRTPHWSSSPDT